MNTQLIREALERGLVIAKIQCAPREEQMYREALEQLEKTAGGSAEYERGKREALALCGRIIEDAEDFCCYGSRLDLVLAMYRAMEIGYGDLDGLLRQRASNPEEGATR